MAESIRGTERRIVLVGQPGSGKSETGNTILGRRAFQAEMFFRLRANRCQRKEAQLEGREVVVVNTPSFFESRFSWQILSGEINRCLSFCAPGPHVILQVISLDFFSQADEEVARLMKELPSLNAKNYMILLFTGKDELDGYPLEEFLSKGDASLWHQVSAGGQPYLAFNNMARGAEREEQVAQLMAMIDELVQKNQEAPCYTEEMLAADQEKLRGTQDFPWVCPLL